MNAMQDDGEPRDTHNGLGPVRLAPAHELVLDQIRRSIELGQFRPGDHMPSERDLAELLSVSRTTVRTAIAMLERDGHVSVKRGRGGGITVLPPMWGPDEAHERVAVNRAALQDIFDYRAVVEVGGARLAAERRSESDVARLDELVARLDAALSAVLKSPTGTTVAEFQALDSKFHVAVAQASANHHLVEAVGAARRQMWRPVGFVFGHLEPSDNDHHTRIAAAISEGQVDAAGTLMNEHIEHTRETVQSWLDQH